jgi:hypothetical protein
VLNKKRSCLNEFEDVTSFFLQSKTNKVFIILRGGASPKIVNATFCIIKIKISQN